MSSDNLFLRREVEDACRKTLRYIGHMQIARQERLILETMRPYHTGFLWFKTQERSATEAYEFLESLAAKYSYTHWADTFEASRDWKSNVVAIQRMANCLPNDADLVTLSREAFEEVSLFFRDQVTTYWLVLQWNRKDTYPEFRAKLHRHRESAIAACVNESFSITRVLIEDRPRELPNPGLLSTWIPSTQAEPDWTGR